MVGRLRNARRLRHMGLIERCCGPPLEKSISLAVSLKGERMRLPVMLVLLKLFAMIGATVPALAQAPAEPSSAQLDSAPLPQTPASTPVAAPAPGANAEAGSIAPQSKPVKREILALYDGRYENEPHLSRIHKFAEMPLNYLGFSVVYWDIDKGLPEPQAIERFRGVLTWFEEPLTRASDYLRWAQDTVRRGARYVILGSPGAQVAPDTLGDINGLLSAIGLKHSGEFVDVTFSALPIVKNRDVLEFERKLDPVVNGFALIAAEAGDVVSHLTMATNKSAGAQSSVLVATSPRGGFVSDEYTIFYEPLRDRVNWVLNPFNFFKLAFGPERVPVPDVTTMSGRRIYFSHVDGDGWNNVSDIEKYKRTNTVSAEVVLKELIEPYPDLPVTVGLIAGDIDPELGGDPTARSVAQRIYALPQVEVGSHTYTHPYNWRFFERYNREDELKIIDKQQRVERKLYDRAIGTLMALAKKEKPQHKHQRYIAGSDDLPRTYLRRPFEIDLEVEGSLRTVEQLAPKGKRAMLLQWSGDTLPFEAAVRASREAGVRNINGGDSRFDLEFPSIVYVPPVSRPVGTQRQIYSVNSNENTYTNDWTGPYYAFRKLEETVRNTEGPRRLKAFNVYYHMYSGEKPAALEAVKQHLQSARNSPVIPLPASLYAGIADGFFEAEIKELGPSQWSVAKRGELQTVRFDDAATLGVDFPASRGVTGQNRHAGGLYVSLDPDIEIAVVVLTPGGSEAQAAAGLAPMQPYLSDSRWRVSELTRGACGFVATAEGFGPGQMLWQGLAAGKYAMTAKRGDDVLWRQDVLVDDQHAASLTIETVALTPLTIELSCTPAS